MRVWKLLGNYVLYKYPKDVYLFTKIPNIYIYIKYFINNLFHFIKIFFFLKKNIYISYALFRGSAPVYSSIKNFYGMISETEFKTLE